MNFYLFWSVESEQKLNEILRNAILVKASDKSQFATTLLPYVLDLLQGNLI